MALILVGSGRLQAFRDTTGDQRHAASQYSIAGHSEVRAVAAVRNACGGTWCRRPGAAVAEQGAVFGAALWSAVRGTQPARDRGGALEPSGAALPCGLQGPGSPIDPVGCECAAACGGVCAIAGNDDQAGPSRTAPQARRDDLSDRRYKRAAERTQCWLGA